MSNDPIISVQGVSKRFCRSLKRTMLYGVTDVARDLCGVSQQWIGLRPDEFWALDDVSFDVQRGECLGLIGPNGAGKSTLLKLLNGITLPNRGMIKISGRVGALLELGAGFHPMLTGRENIYLNAAILGLTKDEIADKFDSIVDFAGLEEFIDSPVKHYSSGMYVRLGFAIAVHAEPDIFLIDEALAVGDALFQSRCFAKIREFREKGKTIIFVTQSVELVTVHCNRVLLVERGRVVAAGDPKEVVDRYYRAVVSRSGKKNEPSTREAPPLSEPSTSASSTAWNEFFSLNPDEDRYGNKKAEIVEAGIFSQNDDPVQLLERNREYMIKVKVQHRQEMPAAIIAYSIRNPQGLVLCGTNTLVQAIDMGWMKRSETVVVTFRQKIQLNPGKFLLCVGAAAYENGEYVVYDRRFDYMVFEVVSTQQRVGLFDLNSTIEWAATGTGEPGIDSNTLRP